MSALAGARPPTASWAVPAVRSTREPRPLPVLKINPAVTRLEDFVFEDFTFEGYDPHPHIKAAVAV